MKVFKKTKELSRQWGNLISNWIVAREGGTDEERLKVLRAFSYCLYDYNGSYIPDLMRDDLLEVCDNPDELQAYFGSWLHYVCGLCYDLQIPDCWQGEDKFNHLPEKIKSAWCDTLDEVQALPVYVACLIHSLKRQYNIKIEGELPAKISAKLATLEAPQSTITDGEGQLTTDEKKSRFRAKYKDHYIKDMEPFFVEITTMKGKELARFYKRSLSRSPITLKEFVEDVITITPERENEKGWNYEAIRKH